MQRPYSITLTASHHEDDSPSSMRPRTDIGEASRSVRRSSRTRSIHLRFRLFGHLMPHLLRDEPPHPTQAEGITAPRASERSLRGSRCSYNLEAIRRRHVDAMSSTQPLRSRESSSSRPRSMTKHQHSTRSRRSEALTNSEYLKSIYSLHTQRGFRSFAPRELARGRDARLPLEKGDHVTVFNSSDMTRALR